MTTPNLSTSLLTQEKPQALLAQCHRGATFTVTGGYWHNSKAWQVSLLRPRVRYGSHSLCLRWVLALVEYI